VLFGLGLAGVAAVGWSLASLTGPARLLLAGVGGLFLCVLAFGTLVGVR